MTCNQFSIIRNSVITNHCKELIASAFSLYKLFYNTIPLYFINSWFELSVCELFCMSNKFSLNTKKQTKLGKKMLSPLEKFFEIPDITNDFPFPALGVPWGSSIHSSAFLEPDSQSLFAAVSPFFEHTQRMSGNGRSHRQLLPSRELVLPSTV